MNGDVVQLEQDLARQVRLVQQLESCQVELAALLDGDRLDDVDTVLSSMAELTREIEAVFRDISEHRLPPGADSDRVERLRRLEGMSRDCADKASKACAANEERVVTALRNMAARIDHVQTGKQVLRRYHEDAEADRAPSQYHGKT